jgi:hypothetical protein
MTPDQIAEMKRLGMEAAQRGKDEVARFMAEQKSLIEELKQSGENSQWTEIANAILRQSSGADADNKMLDAKLKRHLGQ